MGDLTKNISRHETACKCGCGMNCADITLVKILQETADYFEEKYKRESILIITSWNRCRDYNNYLRAQGHSTAKNSKHILGIAVDFKILTVPVKELYDYLDKKFPDKYGVILYSNWVHFDIRLSKYRDLTG